MAQIGWKLDQLKSSLSARREVKAWIITQEHVQRRERYFMMDGKYLVTDQDREVHAQNIQAKIIVDNGKPGRQGEISKKFFTSLQLSSQLDEALEAAKQTDHQAWDLPSTRTDELPKNLKTADPRMAEDIDGVMKLLTNQIELAVAKPRTTVFNSAELFLSIHDRELHLSSGLIHRASQSRIYTEAAYSMARKGSQGQIESDEYLNTRWGVSLDEFSIEKLFDETSDRAEHSLDNQKPLSGRYAVIVDADVLALLFNDYLTQLSASNSYNGLPFIKPGDEFIPACNGDPLTLSLDPYLDFGADTGAISSQGVAQRTLKLVDRNQVIATASDKQYADYLAMPATTSRGNVVIDAGTLTHAELTRQAPMVIEILQFSALFADPNSGTFSSEIRLAKLYDNARGTVTYLKGGSLSGSIRENFKGARFTKNRVRHSHFESGNSRGRGYFGPEFALLNDVSVVS